MKNSIGSIVIQIKALDKKKLNTLSNRIKEYRNKLRKKSRIFKEIKTIIVMMLYERVQFILVFVYIMHSFLCCGAQVLPAYWISIFNLCVDFTNFA